MDRVLGPTVITAPGAAICAGLTMWWSIRLIGLVRRDRRARVVRDRIRSVPRIAELQHLRRTLVTLVDRVRPLIERASGSMRSRRRTDRNILVLLESITRRLRSGSSLRTAVASAAQDSSDPVDQALTSSLEAGAPLTVVLKTWMGDADPSRVLTGTALRLAAESGGPVAVVLDGVAESVRDRVRLDQEIGALASQARASAFVLILAPVIFAILMATADPRLARLQFGSPLGWICCLLGVTLDIAGALWMSRMIGRVR